MNKIVFTGVLVSLIFLLAACQRPPYTPARFKGKAEAPTSRSEAMQGRPVVGKKEAAPRGRAKQERMTAEAPAGPPEIRGSGRVTREVLEKEPAARRPAPRPGRSAEREEVGRGYVALNFDNADVYDFIQSVSEITGINYVVAPGVAGKITVQTSGGIPVEDVLKLMDTILGVYKLAAVESEEIYKIVPLEQVKKVGPEMFMGREIAAVPQGDKVIVQIVKLYYLSPGKAIELLQPFAGVSAEIVPFPLMNTMLIIDSGANVRRLMGLVDLFDVDLFENLGVGFFPLQHILPSELAQELQDIFAALGISSISAGGGLEMIPFDRLNSLLIIASTPRLLKSAEDWLRELDRPTIDAGIQTHVYYLESGDAVNIADILRQLFLGQEKKTPRPPGPRARQQRTPAPKEGAKKKAATRPKAPTPGRSRLTELVRGEVKIVADEDTNALIVQASRSDYRIIEKTIKELDLRPKQVLIEVLIAEVTLTKGLAFGVQWTVGHSNESKSTQGMAKSLFVPAADITDISDFKEFFTSLAASTTGFTYSLTSGDEIFALLDALATVTTVDILSSPHILASGNMEATINVGDEVPIVTSEQLPVGAEETRFRNIQYRQTGITLTVTPHINSKNLVTIDIKQEVSEVAAAGLSAVQLETPTISTRAVETTIVVQDVQTILMGGLISRNKQKVTSKVPLLGDIPILGWLFRSSSDSYARRELILLITPRVISNDVDAVRLTKEFTHRIESLKERMKELRR